VPGQIVAERYRIVALAGRGGMGEVYRAEDLKLIQMVAIKFLPESVSRDAGALARFRSEVRIARQVSHPNVCRMFDIGDADGITFLTMEFVDGEDLSSVVRRIGRLSPDKATEIARQICAGLAAAHDRGVVHRDLKPANVMLDGSGKARITDFGLAGIAASIQGAEVRAGTPAYMAPEQLAGKEVTAKSDLYSLGLVLYEILTGKRAFDAASLPELMRLRDESAPTKPSLLVRDLDPLLERVIMRCLEKDPALRPASALQVAAALPGGDPLAAALAAGETPSPQMVAAAGETGALSPRIALAALAALLLGTVLFLYIGVKEDGLEILHPTKSPEVLAHQASEILSKIGYPEQPADWVGSYAYNRWFIDYVGSSGSAHDWKSILLQRPVVLEYWYRQSPSTLVSQGSWSASITPGVVTSDDPASAQSGMITIWMDAEGHLQWLQALPPEMEPAPAGAAVLPAANPQQLTSAATLAENPIWKELFSAAGIDPKELHPVSPSWVSLAAFDTRAAWDGTWPLSNRPMHVEAASWHGKPVFFALTGPWSKFNRTHTEEARHGVRLGNLIELIVLVVTLVVGVLFAIHNLKRGRGDRKIAWRLACATFAGGLGIFLLRAHLAASLSTLVLIVMAISTSLFTSGALWVLYVAVEPYVRRNWPQTLISWTRLMSGRFRDPLVGRDVVLGIGLGLSWVLTFEIGSVFQMRGGAPPQFPSADYLMGVSHAAANWLSTLMISILGTLLFFVTLVLLRMLVRNRWLAAVLFVALFTIPRLIGSDHIVAEAMVWIVIYGIAAIAVVRFGLIVLGITNFTVDILANVPCTLNFSYWYASQSMFIVLIFVAVGAWGVYTALAGQPLWKSERLD
jgi:serine/threonine protein kinase